MKERQEKIEKILKWKQDIIEALNMQQQEEQKRQEEEQKRKALQELQAKQNRNMIKSEISGWKDEQARFKEQQKLKDLDIERERQRIQQMKIQVFIMT